jgi:ATP-dependent DNA helicase RecG
VQDVPLEDISSLRRNPVLADVMAQLDYMEKRGSGLKRICNETKALESYKDDRRPVFKSSPSQFMTIIYSMEYDGQLNGQLSGTLNGTLSGTLNERQKSVLDFIVTTRPNKQA